MRLRPRATERLPSLSVEPSRCAGETRGTWLAARRRTAAIASALVLLCILSAGLAYHVLSWNPIVAEIALGQPVSDSPMIVDARDGHLFVLSSAARGLPASSVTMIDLRSGAVIHRVPVGIGQAQLSFDSVLDRVVVAGAYSAQQYRQFGRKRPDAASPARLVVELDGRTGTAVRSTLIPGSIAALDEDVQVAHLFIAGGGGAGVDCNICPGDPSVVTMLDARTLKQLAVLPVGDTPRSVMVDQRNARVYVTTNGGLYVLDARTGAQISWLPPGGGGTVLAIDQPINRVLVAADGATLALDGRTGRQMSRMRSVEPADLSYFGDTVLLTGPRTGHLYYVDLAASGGNGAAGSADLTEADGTNGRIINRCATAARSPAFALLPAHDRVAVTDMQTNTVQVVDMATCAVVQSETLAHAPIMIASDEVSGRLVVAADEQETSRDGWSWLPTWLRSRVPFVPQIPVARAAPAAAANGIVDLITLQQ